MGRRAGSVSLRHSQDGAARVVVFAAHFAPHVGGVERYTQCLWSHMAQRGWRVLVVTADASGPEGQARTADLGVLVLPAWRVLDARVPVPRPTRELRALWLALRRVPPDVFVCNTRFFPTSALAALLALRTRRPLLHIEHGSAPVTVGRPVVDKLTGAIDRLVGGWVVRQADRSVGVSEAAATFLRSAFGVDDAGLLPNGVEPDGWCGAAVDYRARLGLGTEDVLVVYAGRLIAAKGVLDLLAALSRVGDAGRGLRLAVAGDGPLAMEVRRRAAADQRVVALGGLAPHQVHDLLVAADVVAHPSAYPEGLPTVLLEAAAAGAAIVATAAGGTTDLVRHGETGLIVPVGDSERLRQALELLASDAALRQRLAAAARRAVCDRFSWPTIADTLERELAVLRGGRDEGITPARRLPASSAAPV